MSLRYTPRPILRSFTPPRASSSSPPQVTPAGQNAKRMIESILNLPGINDVLRFTGTLGFKSVAKKMGVKWEDRVSKYEAVQNELEEIFKETNNPNIEYPSYYFTPVHAYTKANLNWTAAYEAENALEFLAMARYELQGNPEQAKEKLFQRIKEIILEQKPTATKVLDLCCGTGISSYQLAEAYPDAEIVGVDLSPHFLSLAKYETKQTGMASRSQFLHLRADEAAQHLPNDAFDVVQILFTVHECPPEFNKRFVENAFKLCKPGGILVAMDSDPTCSRLTDVARWKRAFYSLTEPFLSDFLDTGIEPFMKECGFVDVVGKRITDIECVWTGIKPTTL